MPEAVVDHFEPIEIQKEDSEPLAGVPMLVILEPTAENFEEVRAVSQARQRIAKTAGAESLLIENTIGHVGHRARNPRSGPAVAGDDPAAQDPPIGAVLVKDPVLVLEVRRFACDVRLDS